MKTFPLVKKLLFFNRIPIIDNFVIDMISNEDMEITIVRTTLDLTEHLRLSQFDFMLLNVDDRLTETSYIADISQANNQNIKVIVFGQYEDQRQALVVAGVNVFLMDDPAKEDFESALH